MRAQELGPVDRGREELVAELTSSHLSAEAGIAPATIENSAAYIDDWRGVLKDDRRALVVAASAAQWAADYILDRQPAGTDEHAIERDRERATGAQRDANGPEPGETLEPTTDLDEPRMLAEARRGPEESR